MTTTEDTAQDGTGVERGNYRYATIVRQTMYDPVNDVEEGRIEIVAGQFDDGVIRTVFDGKNGGFVEIEGEQLDQFHADTRMSEGDIKSWAARQANESEVDYSDV